MVLTSEEQKVRSGFWPKLAKVFASIPFAEDAVAAYYCAFDRATPLKVGNRNQYGLTVSGGSLYFTARGALFPEESLRPFRPARVLSFGGHNGNPRQ